MVWQAFYAKNLIFSSLTS